MTSSVSSLDTSSYQPTAASGIGRTRRRSEEIDYFLTKKELDLDGLLWDDFKNTRLGHKITFQMANKDRDLKALKEKVKLLEDKVKMFQANELSEFDSKVHALLKTKIKDLEL
jgi:hypothetical protein